MGHLSSSKAIGGLKPHLGVGDGGRSIPFVDEGTDSDDTGATGVDIDDAFGFALRAGSDMQLGSATVSWQAKHLRSSSGNA